MRTKDAVLLVEDDADLRESLAFLVESLGCRVVEAGNGREALERIREGGKPSLIILDLMMPVMDGWALRAELLKDPDLSRVPVVLLSGIGDLAREVQSLAARDYLSKPVDVDKLEELLATYC